MSRSIHAVFAVFPLMLGMTAIAADIGVDVRFSNGELSVIRAYYEQHAVTERKKKDGRSLPPGIAKNLNRGKSLPPGIAKQALPGELLRQLPPVHDGFERVVVDGKVLLVEVATQVIHDVLSDAILK